MWGKYASAAIACGPHTGKTSTLQQMNNSLRTLRIKAPQTLGRMRRHHHTGRDSFTMQPVTVAHFSFDSMTKSMAKIE